MESLAHGSHIAACKNSQPHHAWPKPHQSCIFHHTRVIDASPVLCYLCKNPCSAMPLVNAHGCAKLRRVRFPACHIFVACNLFDLTALMVKDEILFGLLRKS
jgi:hypothetical protein